jgi:hypothetical protein
MPDEYRHNHYVPEWYQKRFIPTLQENRELFYLDLHPGSFIDGRGASHSKRGVRRLGFKFCFAQRDLYTTRLQNMDPTGIEKQFFGAIDREGRTAVEYYANFAYPWDGGNHLQEIMMYMSTQKLRTVKGLQWLQQVTGAQDHNQLMAAMLSLRQLYCAIWTECVWLLADASQSETKFIISDHPVTVYNRRCGPRSRWCRGVDDPEIRLHGTHTIFPLSMDKVLILTNLSWVRNPYQSEVELRPNPNPFRSTMFKVTDIQTLRHLNEQEVREINFIIKSRALRYIGAAREEWLYPERFISKSDWNRYGNGYLLMPDPRSVTYSGEIIIGYGDGSATAYDEYGRRPWEAGFSGGENRANDDWHTFLCFQGEFARIFGPARRGRAFGSMHLDNERDSDDYHQYHLRLERKEMKRQRHKKS